jgi:hypothetical protein
MPTALPHFSSLLRSQHNYVRAMPTLKFQQNLPQNPDTSRLGNPRNQWGLGGAYKEGACFVCPSQHPMPKRAAVLHLQLEPKPFKRLV